MDGQSVVVPAATATSAVAVHRSLGRRGIPTIAVSESDDVPSFSTRYCEETVSVPSPSDDLSGYREALLSLAKRPDVRTIVPLRESDIFVLSKYRDAFAEHIATPWPPFKTLRTVHDRERLFDKARAAGVPVPETELFDDVDDWQRELVIKPRFAFAAGDYFPDRDNEEILDIGSTQFLSPDDNPDLDDIRASFDYAPHVQQYVRGTEYSVGVLYDAGEPVVSAHKRIIRGVKYYCGPSVCHEQVDSPELEETVRTLLEQLDWHGPADVDIIQDGETGEFKLLEINPRFWATVANEIHAGFDFPYYYWCLAGNDTDFTAPDRGPGHQSHYLMGELSHLQSVLTTDHPLSERPSLLDTSWELLRSLVSQPRFDLFALDDPRPFVHDVVDNVR
ncbi:MAG: ATP-grasp domain-containing protein [Haloarculaceae archaeon]